MNKLDHIGWVRLRLWRLIGSLVLLWGLAITSKTALAHPADVYLQATYITVAPTEIVVELNLSLGVLAVPQVLPELDPDGDQQITEDEGKAYLARLVDNLVLEVDGKALTLAITKIELPSYLNLQAGYGKMGVFITATPSAGIREFVMGTHQLYYQNNNAPAGVAYQVNALLNKEAAITLGKQNRDAIQQRMKMEFAIGEATSSTALPVATAASDTTAAAAERGSSSVPAAILDETPTDAWLPEGGQAQQLLSYLYEPSRSPWVLLLGLALATLLGGLHALTPGHGKTLVAAYLVGSRGTVKHAIFLGGIVTFTHTASVIVIGLLALFASQFVVPNVLIPLLEIFSGLLVVFLGGRLIWQRWNTFRSNQSHARQHDHDHSHSHDHEAEGMHDHGDGHVHSHLPPVEGIKLSNLLAMGVSGGLVPCPEALGIMVIAIGLNRILLGLGLIVSFSFGLAAVLIAIGILLVRSRALVERFGGVSNRWSSALPLASALIVTVLGIGITIRGLATYLG